MCCMFPPLMDLRRLYAPHCPSHGPQEAVCATFSHKPWEKGGLYAPHSSLTMGEGEAVCATFLINLREGGRLYAPHSS